MNRPCHQCTLDTHLTSPYDENNFSMGKQESHSAMMITRRHFFASTALAASTPRVWAGAPAQAGRKLDFQIDTGFGSASEADIRAVLQSAADSLWKHCPNTRWEVPGFFIYHSSDCPICLNDHRPDGRIAVGLTSQGNLWSQFAYQFAHEFCHALAGHSNDWKATWIVGRKANHWLEESLCETASLFALRAMGKTWQTVPPYPNWKDYASALTNYAKDRLEESSKNLPSEKPFIEWLHESEDAMRQNGTIREKNNVVARQLLPLFEAKPAGWEAVTFYNHVTRGPEKSLAKHFADWSACAPLSQRGFIRELASTFGVERSS